MSNLISIYDDSALSSTTRPAKTVQGHYTIHNYPRISAAKLAEFVVADPVRQQRIVKDSKKSRTVITIPYTKVRNALSQSFGLAGLDFANLDTEAIKLKKAPAATAWAQTDNQNSALALEHMAALSSELNLTNTGTISPVTGWWQPLSIAGVRVSVQPTLVFSVNHRGVSKVGGVILNTGKNEKLALNLSSRGNHTAGDYLAALLYLTLEKQSKNGPPLANRCYAIDIFREDIYTAPTAIKTMVKQMEAACKMISLLWDQTDVETTDLEEDWV